MAFNNFYPQLYGQSNAPQQIQNGGFVLVRTEQEARTYPVAYGNSVTFKDESAPYIYSKTMGFSQLERPVFEKYKLVKEEPTDIPVPGNPIIDSIKDELIEIWAEIDALKNNKRVSKPEVNLDEQCV